MSAASGADTADGIPVRGYLFDLFRIKELRVLDVGQHVF